jgi:hypothetical protein
MYIVPLIRCGDKRFLYLPLRVREPGGRLNNFKADTLNE